MTYILIMSIYIRSFNVQPINMATAEFSSEQACRYAGAQQELALRTDFPLDTSKFYTFICVPKD